MGYFGVSISLSGISGCFQVCPGIMDIICFLEVVSQISGFLSYIY